MNQTQEHRAELKAWLEVAALYGKLPNFSATEDLAQVQKRCVAEANKLAKTMLAGWESDYPREKAEP